MAKVPSINKVIKEIVDSSHLEYLIKKIHDYWHNADENNLQNTNLSNPKTILPTEIKNKPLIEKEIEVTPSWALSLEQQYQLMIQISTLPDIVRIFAYDENQETHINLLRFIARSADWITVVDIWNTCADQCKRTQEQPLKEYFEVLSNALYLYNLTLSDNRARLKAPVVGDLYDYNLQNKAAGNNKNITKVLLPALYSASNKIDKMALVIT